MSENTYDFVVIGAGIAGASVAAELAADGGKVALLEMEGQPGYHTTGRSAAVYAPIYGPAPIRALTRASGAFFSDPQDGFTDGNLISPRPILMAARADQARALEALLDEVADDALVERLDADQTREAMPLLREGYAIGGMLDRNGQDIDVHALHRGYLGMVRRAGGDMRTRFEVSGIERENGIWRVTSGAQSVEAPVVVNAAGAWADRLGALAGAGEVGLVPKRRTALMVASPDGAMTDPLPITVDVEETFYLKPDAGRLLISPANEDPEPPCDVQPDEMDVAICVDRIERAFDLSIRRIENKWAGLRSFVADKVPVVGFSQRAEGFFWLAGQGGYGIQTAPALSRLAATMARGDAPPADVLAQGLDPAALSPDRPSLAGQAR